MKTKDLISNLQLNKFVTQFIIAVTSSSIIERKKKLVSSKLHITVPIVVVEMVSVYYLEHSVVAKIQDSC